MDKWALWMLKNRFGGDDEQRKDMLRQLYTVRDRVLDNARLAEGETLLDVGTGDGLIGFGALERVGERGHVIFSDISQDLLDHTRGMAEQLGVLDRSAFVKASADELSAIDDAAVDVVTTRSVLIFVEEKQRAFDEFFRVLRSSGRISLFEPINSFGHPSPPHMFGAYNVSPIMDIAQKLRALYDRHLPPDDCAMLGFDERDLVDFAQRAGFREVHIELQAHVTPPEKRNWDAFVRMAPNPLVPTFEQGIAEALTPEETARFVAHVRPLVESGQGLVKQAVTYLWAMK